MVNHKQRKHNQSKGNDQLQTANHKDKRAIRDLTEIRTTASTRAVIVTMNMKVIGT